MIRSFLQTIQAFPRDQRGQTFVEYALLTAVVSIGLIGTFTLLGVNLSEMFSGIWERIP